MPPDQAPRGGIGAAVAAAERRARVSLMRGHGGGHAPVSNLELFFDLVFVFAITQISGFLHHDLNWHGLVQAMILFLAVWWVWMYTTWVTNWLNPDRLPVRLLLMAMMLLSLSMAVALPQSFAAKAHVFALCYVAMQIGRSAWVAWIFHREKARNARNMLRITLWFVFSAPLWLGGALGPDTWRIPLWLGALAIDYLGPFALFRVPGLGRSALSDWDISGSHMAERCSLFIIIALGEGIVVTGASFAGLSMEAGRIAAFVTAFAGSALMWWLYFDMGAERGARLISGHSQAGRVARNAYTYLHMPIVLGIVISAVGDALLLEQWHEPASAELVWVQTGGMLLFLGGLAAFKRYSNTIGNFPLSHGIAILGYVGLAAGAAVSGMTALRFAQGGTAILLPTAVWEWVSYHGGWMERLEKLGVPYPERMRASFERRRQEMEQKRG